MTQHERILDYMDHFGSITPMDAIFDLGITKLATRIGELRKLGVPIESETVEGKNRYGGQARYKRYWMPRGETRKEG